MIRVKPRWASEIAKIISGNLIGRDVLIDKISINSEEIVGSGCCFVGIRGKNFDGNDFQENAFENGAELAICERQSTNKPCIIVENTKTALLKLAKAGRGKTKIIGVTGSVGKTTVKNMIISVLSQKYSVIGTEGNENNEIGVAKTLLKIQDEDFCVVEMGMRALGEIDLLASVALPELAVITNVKTSHLELLGTEENVLRAKMEILSYTPKYAVLPNDARLRSQNFGKTVTVFVDENIDSSRYKYFENGIEFSLDKNENYSEKMKIYSFYVHNIYNAEIAYNVGKIYGLTDTEISKGISSFKQDKMREEYLVINGITVINDCYNSSYESLKSSLYSLANFAKIKGKRANALIGDMLELGENRCELHTKIGQICHAIKIERLFLYGELVENIRMGAGYGEVFDSKEELINEICQKLNRDDVLLVKASRSLKFENIIEGMKKRNE